MTGTILMKRFILSLLLAAAVISSVQAEDVYRIRFLDAATLKPIAVKVFQLIPIRIIEKRALNDNRPDPNLQFAESFTSDADGNLSLPETALTRLTAAGKNAVTGHCDGYARFGYSREHFPPSPPTFTFHTMRAKSGRVCASLLLSSTESNLILLEPL
jgi:hypothetical protein